MNIQNSIKLYQAASQIANISADDAGALAFMAKFLVQVTLPHSSPGTASHYTRTNGGISLTVQAKPGSAVPYGSYPRLVLAWINTEAVKTKNKRLELGDSLSQFMGQLGLIPTGGRWGTINRLKDQMRRLLSSRFIVEVDDPKLGVKGQAEVELNVSRKRVLFWDERQPDQGNLFTSYIELSTDFFEAITESPVPLDMRALKALKKSPLGLDLYAWLTHRLSYTRYDIEVSWEQLHEQFGGDYARVADFAKRARAELAKIGAIWPELRYQTPRGRLIVAPSPTHIDRVDKLRS